MEYIIFLSLARTYALRGDPMARKNKPLKNPNGAGTVVKLPGRRRKPWRAMITVGWDGTKQIRQTIGYFETKTEALEAMARHKIEPVSPKANITLGELYDEWSRTKYPKISKSTIDNYKAAWLYISKLEKAKFADLRTNHWQEILDECNENGLSLSTLKKIKTVAGMLYKYAIKNDIINKNYAEYIELPKEKEREEREIFSDLDIQTMFKHADNVPYVDTILIMIYTGMRIAEMLELTKFNVNLEAQIIVGGKKTEAGTNRLIPIHAKIFPFIQKWYSKDGQTLICDEDGNKLSPKRYREKKYYPALEQLGIRRLTPHSCRHTFASLMARAKVEPLYIQKIIGHTDYAFTANIYTHPELEELRQAINKI